MGDEATQLLKIEIDTMQFCVKCAGATAVKAVQALVAIVKTLGKGTKWTTSSIWNTHKRHKKEKEFKRIEDAKGEVTLKTLKDKYKGDDIIMFELKEADAKKFITMCEKEGVAVCPLHDLNGEDGMVQFMAASSTSEMIRFNIDKLTEEHLNNKSEAKMNGEVSPAEFTAHMDNIEKGKDCEPQVYPVRVKEDCNSADFVRECEENGIPIMRKEGSDKEFFVTDKDLNKKEFKKTCEKYCEAVQKEQGIDFSEFKAAHKDDVYKSGAEINAADYVHSAKGATEEEKQKNFEEFVNKKTKENFPRGKEPEVNIDIQNRKDVYDLLTNASNDQRMWLCEQNNYQAVPLHNDMIISETDKEIGIVVNGQQYEVDKNLVFVKDGKTSIYCPNDLENDNLGGVRRNGQKIDAKTFKKKIESTKREARKATKSVNKAKSATMPKPKVNVAKTHKK